MKLLFLYESLAMLNDIIPVRVKLSRALPDFRSILNQERRQLCFKLGLQSYILSKVMVMILGREK